MDDILADHYDGEVAVVTGGTRGIGLATARRLAAGGARTICTYRSDEAAASKATEVLDPLPGETTTRQFDVSDESAVEAAFASITDTHRRPTILVANAGVMDNSLFVRMDDETWRSVIETNLHGAFYCIREATRRMLRGDGGQVVSVASVAGLDGFPGQANYAASKAGLIGLTRSVAAELGDRGIQANAVAPGPVETDLYAEHLAETDSEEDPIDPKTVAASITALVDDQTRNGEVMRIDDPDDVS